MFTGLATAVLLPAELESVAGNANLWLREGQGDEIGAMCDPGSRKRRA